MNTLVSIFNSEVDLHISRLNNNDLTAHYIRITAERTTIQHDKTTFVFIVD